MKWLHKRRQQPEEVDVAPAPCEHVTLVPRWDRADDMGRADRVASYRCEACGEEFTRAEGESLRETEAARLRRMVG
jgi:hypothetical protein